MTRDTTRQGIYLMLTTTFIFALQDGISRHLAGAYNVYMIVMIRYWFFALFVIAIAARQTGGVRGTMQTQQPFLQIFRGCLLALEICVMVTAFVLLGLVESHAIFAAYPLIVAALSGPILGETVGWRRWIAIGVGMTGMLIVLQPGRTVFAPAAIVPVVSALMFALYALLTRYAARKDTAMTSFFWTGTVGAIVMTVVGVWFWQPMTGQDWLWMGALCITGAAGHFTLIKCYELAEASAVQPFAYFQMVFAAGFGILLFGEALKPNVAIGALLIVGAGLFILLREHAKAKSTSGAD